MIVGAYTRVSTDDQVAANQDPEVLQLATARWPGAELQWFRDVGSGARPRPQWSALLEACRRGQLGAVVFWDLTRCGRSEADLKHDLSELLRWRVDVASVHDRWLDVPADGPARSMLLALFAWSAKWERERLIERTKAGQARARAQGKHMGRPPAEVSHPMLAKARQLRADGLSWDRVCRRLARLGWPLVASRTLRRAAAGAKVVSGYVPPKGQARAGAGVASHAGQK